MRISTRLFVSPLLLAYAGSTAIPANGQSAVTAASASPSVRWNRLVPVFADQLAASRRAARKAASAAGDSAALRRIAMTPPPILFRVYTLLSIAQYAAVNSARDNRGVSSDAAVAGASAAVLTSLYADSAVRASIAGELARDLEQPRTGTTEAAAAGGRLGDDIAHRVLAWAPPAIRLAAPYGGTIPTGPGSWYSAPGIPPIGIFAATARAWLLDSASQFRPGPPPTYGSAAHRAALAEVKRVAMDRTPEQTAVAQRWNSADPWARWNELAADALRRHHSSDADAARVFAVLNAAASDAIIACFDAKYHYWTIRPSQADTTIVLADSVDLPNFPSYPSGHACSAGAFDGVLGHFFPGDRAEFTRVAEEQAMSRLYGGIHYRFDNDGGLSLGRTVARYAVERERRGGLNGWRSWGVAGSR
jgi:hypothetical protein